MSENTAQQAVSGLASRQYLALLELSKAIASHRDIADLFHDLACGLKNLLNFQNLGVYLHDGTGDVMRLQVLETCEPTLWQAPSEVPIEGTIAGWVWKNQEPLVIHDLQEETRFPVTQILRDNAARAATRILKEAGLPWFDVLGVKK